MLFGVSGQVKRMSKSESSSVEEFEEIEEVPEPNEFVAQAEFSDELVEPEMFEKNIKIS